MAIYEIDGDLIIDPDLLEGRVSILEETIDSVYLPDYMQTEATATINSLVSAVNGKAYVFLLVTDSHNDRNNIAKQAWKDTMSGMAYINSQYKVDAVIHLGDILDGIESADLMKKDLMKPVADMLKVSSKVYICRGNHESDFKYDDPAHYELISTDELYTIEARQNEEYVVRPENKLYYYVDYGDNLRCVFLDSYMLGYEEGQTTADLRENPDRARYGYDSDEIAWFTETALNTDRQVAIFCHMSASTSNMSSDSWWTEENSQSFDDIKAATKEFITGGGTIVGWFYGHIHNYKKTKLSAANFTELGLRNSYYTQESSGGVHSIPNFSVIVIKPDKRRVDVISFGQDSDDYFTY